MAVFSVKFCLVPNLNYTQKKSVFFGKVLIRKNPILYTKEVRIFWLKRTSFYTQKKAGFFGEVLVGNKPHLLRKKNPCFMANFWLKINLIYVI